MNSIERMLTTINHKQPDCTPVYPIVSGVTRLLNASSYYDWATNASVCADALIKAQELLGLDCIITLTDLSVEASDFGQKIIYPKNEAAHPDFSDYLLKSLDDYDLVKEFDPATGKRMSEHIKLCQKLVLNKGQDVPIIAFVFGPLGILSMLRGQSELFLDLYDDPVKVHQALDKITNTLIKYCDILLNTGIHAIMLDTLFASQSIMSKEMWLEFEGPYVKKIAEFIHSKNKMVMIHNCGNGIYFDAQIEMMHPEVISFLHIPADCESLDEIKNKYGKETTLAGVISPAWLVRAKTEDVEKECKRLIDIFGKDGGFILATGCEYPANMSLDHAKTICQVAKTYNPYKND